MARKKVEIGMVFNRLTAIEKTPKRKSGSIVWLCKCACGRYKEASTGQLNYGEIKSCGCLQKEMSSIAGRNNKHDLIGDKFGRLLVLEEIKERKERKVLYECFCDCGNKTIVYGSNLTRGLSKSCGCLRGTTENLVGKKYGKLKVIKEMRERKNGNKVWLCKCDCGREHKTNTNLLNSGNIRSCGCLKSPDLKGNTYGRLTVLGRSELKSGYWTCKCSCGRINEIYHSAITSGNTKTCGCAATEARKKTLKELHKRNKGKNHYNYNHNITDEERKKMRYEIGGKDRRKWRKSVYERDNYTCKVCLKKGGNLNAHHLNGYHWFENGRYDVENGITLCSICHLNFHSKFGYRNNTKEQFEKFNLNNGKTNNH